MCDMLQNPDGSDHPELKTETKLMIDVVRFDDQVDEGAVMKKMMNMTTSSSSNLSSDDRHFLRSVFNDLSNEMKHKVLSTVSSASDASWFDSCHLSLISLKLMTGAKADLQHQGRNLITQIDRALVHSRTSDPSGEPVFVHMLVQEALPVLLKPESGIIFDVKEITSRLVTVLQYFVTNSSISRSEISEGEDDQLEKKVISIFGLAFASMSFDVSLVQDQDIPVSLVRLSHALSSAGSGSVSVVKREPTSTIHSDAPMDLSVPSSHKKQRTSSLSAAIAPAMPAIKPESKSQLLFSTMLLFLRCLRRYARSVRQTPNVTLIAAMDVIAGSNGNTGAGRTTLHHPDIHCRSEAEQRLRKSFLTCTQCVDMVISTEVIVQEFFPLLHEIGAEEGCHVYQKLRREASLFKAQAADFVRITMPIIASSSSPSSPPDMRQLGLTIQLTSACLTMHDHNAAIRHAVACVQMLNTMGKAIASSPPEEKQPQEESTPGKVATTATTTTAGFRYLSLTTDSILHFCINSLITCLRFTTLLSVSPSDSGIGHLIVLSQYQWPRHADLFQSCISLLSHKHAPSFAYQPFAMFVKEPDILEHFMCLCERLTLNLGLTSVTIKSLSQRQQQSMTTRGVHKGVKEEQRNSLIKQMTECTTLIEPQMFIDFILTVLPHA